MAWPLRKRIYSRNNDIRNRKNYASDSFRFAQILGSTVKGQSEPRSKHPDQNKHCNKFGSKIMIRGVRFNAYFTPSWATLARQCTTEAGSQQIGDNISAACVLRAVGAPWQTFFKSESNEPNVSVSLARVFVGDEFQNTETAKWYPLRGANEIHAWSARDLGSA